MNAVQEIKARYAKKEADEMDALLVAIKPAMDRNREARMVAEARKAVIAARKMEVEKAREAMVNIALYHAGIPLQVL